MDIARSFTFMFEDPEWVRKLGIGVLLILAGIILSPILIGLVPLIILMGYTLDVTRNVLAGRSHPLPEWTDWGGLLMRGLKLFVVFLVWALPILVVMFPMILIAALLDNSARGSEGIMPALVTLFTCCLVVPWSILLTVISPAIYVRLAQTDEVVAGFDVRWIWAFTRDNLRNVIIAVLLVFVAQAVSLIIGMAGILALFIGLLVTIPLASLWQMLVQAHLFGQVGRANSSAVV